jgi:excisionase family DNA binding protein
MERLTLRPAELAEALGISRSKAYELLARGEFPTVRIGSSIRIPVDSLKRWVAEKSAEGGQAVA